MSKTLKVQVGSPIPYSGLLIEECHTKRGLAALRVLAARTGRTRLAQTLGTCSDGHIAPVSKRRYIGNHPQQVRHFVTADP